jgi:bifunctional isochorismate lyase/aryl carrier protein
MGIPRIKPYDLPTVIDFARAPRSWRVEPARVALLIHDMQNYFLKPYESAAFTGALVEQIHAIRTACKLRDVPVFYTAQPGGQSKAERGLLLDFWGPGMPEDGEARSIVRGLEPSPGDHMIVKHRYSAFKQSELLEMLKRSGREQLIICGVYAHIGCQATALDAFMAGVQPFVAADALGDFSLEYHRMALSQIASCSGKVATTAELLEQLGGAS